MFHTFLPHFIWCKSHIMRMIANYHQQGCFHLRSLWLSIAHIFFRDQNLQVFADLHSLASIPWLPIEECTKNCCITSDWERESSNLPFTRKLLQFSSLSSILQSTSIWFLLASWNCGVTIIMKKFPFKEPLSHRLRFYPGPCFSKADWPPTEAAWFLMVPGKKSERVSITTSWRPSNSNL